MDQANEKLLTFLCDNCGETNTIDKFLRLHDPDPNFYRNSPDISIDISIVLGVIFDLD